MKDYKNEVRILIPAVDVAALRRHFEPTAKVVWMGHATRCRQGTIRGVPAKRVDFVVDENLQDGPAVLEVGAKTGMFDGATRCRFALRAPLPGLVGAVHPPEGRLSLAFSPTRVEVRVALDGEGEAAEHRTYTFERARYTLDVSKSLRHMVMWHWQRYYRHLSLAQAARVACDFAVAAGTSLTEANRAASRALYEASREVGWRKLTLREQRKFGVTGQWHLVVQLGSPTGCGEYTLSAARCSNFPTIDSRINATGPGSLTLLKRGGGVT